MAAGLIAALLTLAFARVSVEPARPGVVELKPGMFAYVVSTTGAYQLPHHPPKSFHPAFVLSLENKFRVGVKTVKREGITIVDGPAGSRLLRYSDGFLVHKGPVRDGREVDEASTVKVSPSGEEYLVVKWQREAGKCEFSLFKIEPELLVAASENVYECKP